MQRLASSPDPAELLRRAARAEPSRSAASASSRSGPTIETVYPSDLNEPEFAIEVCYEGGYEFDEATLADGSILDDHFSAMGGWISSTLVRVGDLKWDFLPPLDLDDADDPAPRTPWGSATSRRTRDRVFALGGEGLHHVGRLEHAGLPGGDVVERIGHGVIAREVDHLLRAPDRERRLGRDLVARSP